MKGSFVTSTLRDVGPHMGHIRPNWNMDVGRFLAVLLLSSVRVPTTATFQLSGFCRVKSVGHHIAARGCA